MNKYRIELVNNNGCLFDSIEGDNKKDLIAWARGRGGNYKAILYKGQEIIKEWEPRK